MGEPTTYFRIDPTHPKAAVLSGTSNAELIAEPGVYMAHIAPGFYQPIGGVQQRWSREGHGDIVVQNVSQESFDRICAVVSAVEDQARGKVIDAIIALDFITWDRPQSGR